MRRLIDLYATQAHILWDWRGGPVALAKRLLLTAVVAAVAFGVTAAIMPGVRVDTFLSGILAIFLVALFNALIRPVLLLFVAPRSLILTAIVVLVLQVVAFYLVATISPGVHVDRITTAIIASFLYAAINTSLTAILGVDSGGSYYGTLVQSLRAKTGAVPSDKPGLVIIQIDGLAHPIIAARIRAGSVTTMSSWVRGRTHKLSQWEALLPSMTSASQLGILHGNNDGLPAFRWFERDTQTFRVSSKPADAAELVRRASNGEGLLSNDGVSICNLVTGDATRSYLTTAGLVDGSKGIGDSKAFYGFFLSPSGYLRSITLFIAEVLKERYQARRTRRRGITPQMHRGMKYAGMRAASNVLLRDINVSLIIEEMYRGANVIYADFTDYDELAHHCGPERVESFEALDGVDDAIGTLAKAAESAPRPYRFIVLSDHGQSLGATFKQRYGESLGDLVLRLMGGRAKLAQGQQAAGEGSAFLNAFLSEVTRSRGAGASVARLAFRNRTTADGVVDLDAPEPRRRRTRARSRWSAPATWGSSTSPGTTTASRSRSSRTCTRALSRRSPSIRRELRPGPLGDAGRHGDRPAWRLLPRRRAGGGRGSHRGVRSSRPRQPPPGGGHAPRRGPAADQPVRPGARRGRGLRGADRLARRPRRHADEAVHPPPHRLGARRAGPAGGAGDLPQPAALAVRDRDRARPSRRGGRGDAGFPGRRRAWRRPDRQDGCPAAGARRCLIRSRLRPGPAS